MQFLMSPAEKARMLAKWLGAFEIVACGDHFAVRQFQNVPTGIDCQEWVEIFQADTVEACQRGIDATIIRQGGTIRFEATGKRLGSPFYT